MKRNRRSIAAKRAWRERKARAAYYAWLGVVLTPESAPDILGAAEFHWKMSMAEIEAAL